MKSKSRTRSGTAVVELAVCLPVIFLVVFGSIEACNLITLKQIVTEAAYDGALTAIRPGVVESDVVNSVSTILTARSVTPTSIAVGGIGGSSFASVQHGDTLVVTVTAVSDGNLAGPQLFGLGTSLSGIATAVKQ